MTVHHRFNDPILPSCAITHKLLVCSKTSRLYLDTTRFEFRIPCISVRRIQTDADNKQDIMLHYSEDCIFGYICCSPHRTTRLSMCMYTEGWRDIDV